MKSIFLTGATGFIGSHFLNKAHENGVKTVAIRRSEHSKTRIKLDANPMWLTKQMDEILTRDLEDIDTVVHLAAHAMYPPYDSLENCFYWNVTVPIKLFNNAIEAGVKKFVIAGSCFEYGDSGEEYDFIPVDAPLKPTLTYAASKAAASVAFYQLAVEMKLMLSIHRIFHVYGEGESEKRLWPSLKKAAENGSDFPMTKGEQVRDFIPVHDVVNELWKYTSEDITIEGKPAIKNLGSGKPQTVKEFCEYWWEKWNAPGKLLIGELPYREGEVMRFVPKI